MSNMAANMEHLTASPRAKKCRKEDNLRPCLVEKFLVWCKDVELSVSDKVTVQEAGSCHRFGMIALDDIEEGECLFKIPRTILLEPSTSPISGIILGGLNQSEKPLTMVQKWLPLMVTLLYEYTNSASKWRPYLDLVPSKAVLNQPIFWSEQERELLELVDMKKSVDNDIKQIEEQYNTDVLPFIKANSTYFDPEVHTLELYKHLSGFVMAYSFSNAKDESDEAPPALVPMADILNHVSEHNAHLEFGENHLSMVAIKPIEKGQEVFNTYGDLVNCSLLHSYGFIENCPNLYDMVEIPLEIFKQVLSISDEDWRNKMATLDEELPDRCNEPIFFDVHGCLGSEDEFFSIFCTLHKTGDTDSEEGVVYISDSEDTRCLEDCMNEAIALTGRMQEAVAQRQGNDGDGGGNQGDAGGNNGEDEDDMEDQEEDSESGDEREDMQIYAELSCLKPVWKQTLYRAAKICSEKVQGRLMKLSESSPSDSEDPRRRTMVENILRGRIRLLKLVEELKDYGTR